MKWLFAICFSLMLSSQSPAQGVGGGGSGGGGLLQRITSASHRENGWGCREGDVRTMSISRPGKNERTESRRCVNGSYMTPEERAAYIYVPKMRCLEGSLLYDRVVDRFGREREAVKVCRGGIWLLRGTF